MQSSLACRRYLQRHSETGLTDATCPAGCWQNVLVIPAYSESPELLQRLARLPAGSGKALVILILNRPDSDPNPDTNSTLREACKALPAGSNVLASTAVRRLNQHTDLYLHDLDRLIGPIPATQGVGLARKIGCDLAFRWMMQGAIAGSWISSGDADAQFPSDYFLQLDSLPAKTAAAIYPFRHMPGPDEGCNAATALYELRLHHYRLGLEYAASPYALHTLGSCLAMRADHYAQVRGFPKRAGGEDFYLLNKLAKTGPIEKLTGNCIELQSRHSNRAPFGTGPAVAAITAKDNPLQLALYYHPACFEALRCLLIAIPALQQNVDQQELEKQLQRSGLAPDLIKASIATAHALGLKQALLHCRRQGKTSEQFLRQFHQWFDAFRTLKFIHGLRDMGWPAQTLSQLQTITPRLWPACDNTQEPEALQAAVMRHWGWVSEPLPVYCS
jgi:hypothetical protein